MKKKLFLTALLAGLLMATPAMAEDNVYESGTPITIHIDGEYLPCDVDPVMVNNRTLMPMRAAGEALGATVSWDGANQAATLTKDDKTVVFYVGSFTYYVNGAAKTVDVPPQIVQGRTVIPLRAFGEALDTRVDWNQYQLDVSISTTGEPAALPTLPAGDMTNEAMRWVQKYYTPEQNDILGGWKHSSNSYGSSVTEYDFFYNLNGTIQNVNIYVSTGTPVSPATTIISKNEVSKTADGYQRPWYQNVIYYKGPARGFVDAITLDYQMVDNSLVLVGQIWTDVFGENPPEYVPDYQVYTRF